MKKLFVVLSILFAFQISVSAQTLAPKVKIETVHSLKNDVLTSLKTEATQDSIVSIVTNADLPESGSTWKIRTAWILGILILLIGAIVANVPTKKNKWYLQTIQVVFRFIIKHLLAPENKKTDGTNHSV